MANITNYNFKLKKKVIFTPEQYFMNYYIDECFESEILLMATNIFCTILCKNYFFSKSCTNN